MHKKIALGSLILILILVNWSIVCKENHLTDGRIVYLELAPVDPRSLMQGDYMALRFRLADEVSRSRINSKDRKNMKHDVTSSDGFVVASLDEQKICTFKSLYTGQPLSGNEILLYYRIRNGLVKFATNAYFFQEGHGKYYQPARYGQFRVDKKGKLLLVAMYDNDLNKLEPEK
ncbi:GDYXXLXY domain-containing protein [Desulfogranum japonicum]|uniref:GDYXXLXY domain-containing protein n=1 Tax=Desulfogranum japonicum TaxID=231447 RepID=UPI0003FA6754|nr:GDYXXLXY domain-containing protein [Desulfogranum japonicum]